jgi:hypothetical protein
MAANWLVLVSYFYCLIVSCCYRVAIVHIISCHLQVLCSFLPDAVACLLIPRYRSDVLHPCYSIVPTVVANTTLKPLSHRFSFLIVP